MPQLFLATRAAFGHTPSAALFLFVAGSGLQMTSRVGPSRAACGPSQVWAGERREPSRGRQAVKWGSAVIHLVQKRVEGLIDDTSLLNKGGKPGPVPIRRKVEEFFAFRKIGGEILTAGDPKKHFVSGVSVFAGNGCMVVEKGEGREEGYRIRSKPVYEWRASGRAMVPSACWLFSRRAARMRGKARLLPLRVCTS